MTTALWLRISAVIALLFAAGHTLGGLKYCRSRMQWRTEEHDRTKAAHSGGEGGATTKNDEKDG